MQGKDLVLTLLPTEWDRFGTRITLAIGGGRVRELSLRGAVARPPRGARHAVRAVQAQVGRAAGARPTTARPSLVFRDDDPHVEVREDTEHGAWQIEIK